MQLSFDDLFARVGTARTRKSCTAMCMVSVIALAASICDPAIIPAEYGNHVIAFTIGTLLASAALLRASRFVTPEIKNAKCSFCDASMVTTSLACFQCGAKSVSNEDATR